MIISLSRTESGRISGFLNRKIISVVKIGFEALLCHETFLSNQTESSDICKITFKGCIFCKQASEYCVSTHMQCC